MVRRHSTPTASDIVDGPVTDCALTDLHAAFRRVYMAVADKR